MFKKNKKDCLSAQVTRELGCTLPSGAAGSRCSVASPDLWILSPSLLHQLASFQGQSSLSSGKVATRGLACAPCLLRNPAAGELTYSVLSTDELCCTSGHQATVAL